MRPFFRLAKPRPWGLRLRIAGPGRGFASSAAGMGSMARVSLAAPNGRSWDQPIGLFINNEFVESQGGDRITTINPAYGGSIYPSK